MGKMRIRFPIHTACLALLMCLLMVAIVVMHIALSDAVPAIQDFPENLRKGFYQVLRIDYLQQDALAVKTAAHTALGKCGVNAALACATMTPTVAAGLQGTADTTAELAQINAKLTSTLDIVQRVATDKYLGTAGAEEAGKELTDIQTQANTLATASLSCSAIGVAYCEIYMSAGTAASEASNLATEVDKFIDSDAVKNWKDYTDHCKYFNVIPYVLVLGVLFFLVFCLEGGVCCCCEGGTMCGFMMIPCGLLSLVFFILNTIVLASGTVIIYFADGFELPVLKGGPSLREALDHFKTAYPDFWSIVFTDMEDGLYLWWAAAIMFEVFVLLFLCFTCNICLCMGYRSNADDVTELK